MQADPAMTTGSFKPDHVTHLLEATIQDFYEHCDDAGQSEHVTPRLLYALVLAARPRVCVEIGTHMGLSSLAIASALKFNAEYVPSAFLRQWKAEWHPIGKLERVRGKLYCIDPELQPHFTRRLQKFNLQPYIEFIQQRSEQVDLTQIPNIDFLFIDGGHAYESALSDFTRYFVKVNAGGYVVLHDYFPDSPTPHMPWWGPNLLGKQLREAFGFVDSLVVDTSFQGMLILRKQIDHIDYDFLDTDYVRSVIHL